MKNTLTLIALIFSASVFSNVQIIEVNQACSTPEYDIPDSPVDFCQLFDGNILGENIRIDALVHPIITDGMNNIVNSGRYVGFGFDNIGFEAYFYNDFQVAKSYEAGEIIDETPGTNPDSQGAIIQAEYFPFGAVLGDFGTLVQTDHFYLGFYLLIDGNKHYGWLQWDFNFDSLSMGLEILQIGIESIPNHPIIAGAGQSYLIGGTYSAEGTLFLDANTNGMFDSGESIFQNAFLDIDNGSIQILNYQSSNPFELSLQENNYNLSVATLDPTLWNATGNTSYTFDLNATNPVEGNLNFGFSPIGSQEIINASISPQTARCNEVRKHVLTINNQGNTLPSGYLSYELDSLVSFVSSFPVPDSTAGNTLYFSYSNLGYLESENICLNLQMPNTDFIGYNLNFELEVFNDLNTTLAADSKTLTVACAYDPNDKTEFAGYTENGFILPGQKLDYLIRFQNTGNDTAYNITLVDKLSSLLDLSTFEVSAQSHNSEVTLTETGELFINFENIFLPDSTTNLEESQGFFSFSISALESIGLGDSIENFAEIYFDFNPPIITNTTINTVFSCDSMANFVVPNELCTGNIFEASSIENYIENYTWSINGNTIGDESNLLYEFENPGDYWLKFSAENPLCQVVDSMLISVLETPLSYAGIDTSFCGIEGSIMANDNGYSGIWSSNDDIAIESENEYESSISVSGQGSYEIIWTSFNGMCQSNDTVSVTFYDIPWVEIDEIDGVLYANTFGDSYQWYFNGDSISGANGGSFTPTENGDYSVSVEGQNDCLGFSQVFNFIIDGIEELNEISIQISPNPFSDFTWIEINANDYSEREIEILDSSGKIIRREKFTEKRFKLERKNLAPGFYILNLKSSEGVVLWTEWLVLK